MIEDRNLLPEAGQLFVDDRPTFAWIHLLPPHGPYAPPPPFRGALTEDYTEEFPVSAAALNLASRAQGDERPTADEVRYVRARYDENVRYADHLVGRLIEIVREAGRYDDALIIVTSDHGEAFFEHGRFLHTRFLYDEFLRVPFVVKWPARVTGFAQSIVDPVSLIDIAPTIIDGLGLTNARTRFQGMSLLPAVFEAASLPQTLYAHTRGVAPQDVPARPWFALRDGPHKIVFGESADSAELFDLTRDAAEQNNLAYTDRLRTQYLVQKLLLQRYRNLEILSASGGAEIAPLDEEMIRGLRALGYVR